MAIENGHFGGTVNLKDTMGASGMLVMFFCLLLAVVTGMCSLREASISYIIMTYTLGYWHVTVLSLLKINEKDFFKKN